MNRNEDLVRKIGVASIAEGFVNPYTFPVGDFFVCEYDAMYGILTNCEGMLLAGLDIRVPDRMAELAHTVERWPVALNYQEAAKSYFSTLAVHCRATQGAPSVFEMLLETCSGAQWICVSAAMIARDGRDRYQIRFLRINNEKQELAKLYGRSQTDPLTQVLNRNGLINAVHHMASMGSSYAFILLDIDGFKNFNATYGHIAGDALLKKIVDELREGLLEEDLIARVGGDEFVICLGNAKEAETVERTVKRIHASILNTAPEEMTLSVSMGVALSPRDGSTFEELYQKTDVAVLHAKHQGGDSYLFYRADLTVPKTPDRQPHTTEADCSHGAHCSHNHLIRYHRLFGSTTYPESLNNCFRATFDERPLWQLLAEDGILQPEAAQKLRQTLEHIAAADEPQVNFSEYLLKSSCGMWRWYRIGIVYPGVGDEISITLSDVNDEILSVSRLRHITEYDELTGLLSHNAFVRAVERMLNSDPEGIAAGQYAVVYVDILRFKAINDRFGVGEGDRLLMYIANVLAQSAGDDGYACRIASDQFALFIHRSGERLEEFIRLYLRAIEQYNLEYEIVSNVGIYVTTDEYLSADAMLDRAILAQSAIKGSYVTRYSYYTEELRNAMLGEQEITGMMNNALAEKQFVVYYQPQYDHSSGKLVGAEALVRWRHPEHGLISPGVFIPIFEKNGFITKLDFYVFEQVCIYLQKCLAEGVQTVPISINLTRQDIYHPEFIQSLEKLRARYNVPVELLRIEITETAVAGDNQHASRIIEQLHEHGYMVEMDDFGSGYSSLNVLKDINLDILKLDMHFLSKDVDTNRGGTILSSVVRMAKWLSLPVIAEGVESLQQADYLKSIGCNYIQGFLYARPMPEEDYTALLKDSTVGSTKPPMRLIETMNVADFWDPESRDTLIFSNYVGGAAIFDYHNGQVELLRVNPKYLQEIGIDLNEKELIHRDTLSLFDEKNRKIYIDMLERAIASGDEEESETWRSYTDCECGNICIRSNVRMIGRSKDSFLFYEMIRNITSEKNAIAELMRRESIFRAASEQVNIYYWVYDVATREMQPCFRCMRDLGLPELVCNYPEPAIEMGIFPPEVADMYRDMHRQIHNGVRTLEVDMPLTPDRVMFRVRYTTEFDENGKPVKAYGSAIPI